MADQTAVRVRIHGRVQGVGYRSWTVGQAKKRGLNGWVRNRVDETVEALFVGDESLIREMIEACHKGPLAAKVNKVEQEPAEGITPSGFVQKPTV